MSLTHVHGVEGGHYLGAGHGFQPVLQSFQVHTLLRVVGRVHQHGQAVLHAGQLGRDHRKVLEQSVVGAGSQNIGIPQHGPPFPNSGSGGSGGPCF